VLRNHCNLIYNLVGTARDERDGNLNPVLSFCVLDDQFFAGDRLQAIGDDLPGRLSHTHVDALYEGLPCTAAERDVEIIRNP